MADRRLLNLALGLIAIGLHVGALVSVVQWLSHTDWLFGHYEGPAFLVVTARVCAALGIGTSAIWLVSSLRSARVNLAMGFVLMFLSLPSALLLLGWAAEATRKPRNWWEEPGNYSKPTDPGRQKPDVDQRPENDLKNDPRGQGWICRFLALRLHRHVPWH